MEEGKGGFQQFPPIVVLAVQSQLTLCNPMTVTRQAPLSMEFSRQEYWNGLPFPSPGESSRPRDRKTPVSYVAGRFFTIWATRENKLSLGTSLTVQWLRLCTPTSGATGSIPGLGNKNPHATERSKKEKKKYNTLGSVWEKRHPPKWECNWYNFYAGQFGNILQND